MSIDENHFVDFDKAITHDRNTKLKERHLLGKLFKAILEIKSLADNKTRKWLGISPPACVEMPCP